MSGASPPRRIKSIQLDQAPRPVLLRKALQYQQINQACCQVAQLRCLRLPPRPHSSNSNLHRMLFQREVLLRSSRVLFFFAVVYLLDFFSSICMHLNRVAI